MNSRRFLVIALNVALMLAFSAAFHAQTGATGSAPQRKTSTPYRGDLTIFDSPGRDQRLQIDRVMDILGIGPGKTVADIGAGSGWFTVRAARRVTDTGKVFAADINPEATRYISDRMRKENLHNVEVILSKPDDPMLPANGIDAVLMLKTYHEIEHPVTLLRNLRASLKPGARVGIIDRDGNGENHGVSRDVVIREATEAGYSVAKNLDWKRDGMDYFLVLTGSRDRPGEGAEGRQN